MPEINSGTVITMTLKQLLAAATLLVGSLWAILAFTMGNIRDDVSDIRVAVTANQDRNADTQQYATSTDGELRKEIAALTAELRTTNAGLINLTSSVGGLDKSIRAVDERLTKSVEWQVAF